LIFKSSGTTIRINTALLPSQQSAEFTTNTGWRKTQHEKSGDFHFCGAQPLAAIAYLFSLTVYLRSKTLLLLRGN
jgi:hypothetical protein